MPMVGLQCVIVVYPDDTHSLCAGLAPGLLMFHTQLSTKFILFINVKMPTVVGILTFISMINTASERVKAKKKSSFVGI